MLINKGRSYIFEPGDTLSKIASEEFNAGSIFEAKEKLKKKILESVGNTRQQLKVDIEIRLEDNSSVGNGYQFDQKKGLPNFDAIAKIRHQRPNPKAPDIPITIPISVRDKQLMPMTTAEFGGNIFLLSKAFLNKAVAALGTIAENPYVLDGESSYTAVEKAISPITDDGRIRDVLMIRNKDAGTTGMGASAPILVRASEALDDLLEKSASFTPFSAIESTVKAKAYEMADELARAEFEKRASVTEDVAARIMESASVFEKLKAMDWKRVDEVADKAVVEIVDIDVEAGDMAFKPAVVFKGILSLRGPKRDRTTGEMTPGEFILVRSEGSVIIDECSNYKVLRKSTDLGQRYLVADTKPDFKLKAMSLKTLMAKLPKDHNKQYFILLPDGVLGPVSIRTPFDDNEIFYAESPHDTKIDRVGKTLAASACVIRHKESAIDSGDYNNSATFLLEKNVEGGLKQLSAEERAAILSNTFKNEQHIRWSVEDANLIDDSLMVIEVKDFIRTPVTSLTDVVFGRKDNAPLSKVATEKTVMIEKPVPDANKYNVVLGEGLMKKHKYAGLRGGEVIGLLKSVGVDEAEIISMLGFLNAGERTIERNMEYDLSTIDGRFKETTAANLIKGFAGQMFGRPVQQELLKEIVATQVADLLVEAPSGVFGAASALTSLASDAEALADRFEKLAIEHESKDFQTLAKCCVATARMDRLMDKVARETTTFDARDAFKDLKDLRPLVEKVAGDLYELANAQKVGAEIIGQNTIDQTFRTLQRLYTYGK